MSIGRGGVTRCEDEFETIIVYTILGKRDGHQKFLRELIFHQDLIEKFHPIEALKLGFIAAGDSLFKLSLDYSLESK